MNQNIDFTKVVIPTMMKKLTIAVLSLDEYRRYAIEFRKCFPSLPFPLRLAKKVVIQSIEYSMIKSGTFYLSFSSKLSLPFDN